MKRSDIGKRSQAATGGGFFGTLFGGKGGGGQQDAPIQTDTDRITPRGDGKVKPSFKEVSVGISPYGDVINLPLWERHAILAGQSGSG